MTPGKIVLANCLWTQTAGGGGGHHSHWLWCVGNWGLALKFSGTCHLVGRGTGIIHVVIVFFSPKSADWRPGSLNHSDSVSPKGKSYSSLATISVYIALWIAMIMERGDYKRAKLETWDFLQILKALLPRSPLPELCEKKLNNRRMQIARFTKTTAFLKSLRDPWKGGAVCLMPTRSLLVNLKCFLPTVCLLRANLN